MPDSSILIQRSRVVQDFTISQDLGICGPVKGQDTEAQALRMNVRALDDLLNNPAKLKAVTKQEVTVILKAIYGDELIDRVLAFRPAARWGEKLERGQLLKLLAMAGHAVTVDDLQKIWNKIRVNRDLLDFFRFSSYVSENTEDVRQLPSNDFDTLLQVVRNPSSYVMVRDGSVAHFWEEVVFSGQDDEKRWMAYTHYDAEIHHLAQKADFSKPEFSFAAPEQLAKAVAYADPHANSVGMVIPVFRRELNEVVFYELKSKINEDGLHAYFFAPMGRNDVPAELVFRGTKGMHSAHRDMDTSGVGKVQFEKHSDAICAMFSSWRGEVECIGHSLGAADAQRGTALIVDRFARGERNITGVSLFAYCSPKLDKTTVKRWEENIQAIANMDERCHISLNFAEHASDLVAWAGEKNLLGNASVDFIDFSKMVVSSSLWGLNPFRHHTKPFFDQGNFNHDYDGRSFRLFQSGPLKRLRERLDELEARRSKSLSDSTFGDTGSWEMIRDDRDFERQLTDDEKAEKARLEATVEDLRKVQVTVEQNQKGWSEQSWVAYSASLVGVGFKKMASLSLGMFLRK